MPRPPSSSVSILPPAQYVYMYICRCRRAMSHFEVTYVAPQHNNCHLKLITAKHTRKHNQLRDIYTPKRPPRALRQMTQSKHIHIRHRRFFTCLEYVCICIWCVMEIWWWSSSLSTTLSLSIIHAFQSFRRLGGLTASVLMLAADVYMTVNFSATPYPPPPTPGFLLIQAPLNSLCSTGSASYILVYIYAYTFLAPELLFVGASIVKFEPLFNHCLSEMRQPPIIMYTVCRCLCRVSI